MIKTLIVDDERSARNTLSTIIKRFFDDIEIIGEAGSVQEAIQKIRELKPELVFLDIKMPFGSGFDLLEKMNPIEFEVIFITAHDNYAIRAFRFAAVDYLLKPVNIQELRDAVDRVRKKLLKPKERLNLQFLSETMSRGDRPMQKMVIPTLEGFQVIKLAEIIRMQSERNYTEIHLSPGKKVVVPRTLKEFEEMLVESGFFRIHRSHLVNLDHLVQFTKGKGGEVQLSDGTLLPVSRERKGQLVRKFMNLD